MTGRTCEEVVREFNNTLRDLIVLMEKKSRSPIEVANLDRMKKRIALLRGTIGGHAIVAEVAPILEKYAEQIINRDEEFFNNMDVRGEYAKQGKPVNKSDEFMFELADSIRGIYNGASAEEKDLLYLRVQILFNCGLEYLIMT